MSASRPQLDLEEEGALEGVFELLRASTGRDVREYRRATVLRRIRTRMLRLNAPSLRAYEEALRQDPRESQRLLQAITIKVSSFFRNSQAFEALGRALGPRLAHDPGGLRLWSAGCAHGEEPYSLAMLVDELGARPETCDVLATDIDAAALERARRARYTEVEIGAVGDSRFQRYFEAVGDGASLRFEVIASLRRQVTFRAHDLVSGVAPAEGRFDVICCRNTLIYFQRPLRDRVFKLLKDSLVTGGLLCLGEAEWLPPEMVTAFQVEDAKARLFRRRA